MIIFVTITFWEEAKSSSSLNVFDLMFVNEDSPNLTFHFHTEIEEQELPLMVITTLHFWDSLDKLSPKIFGILTSIEYKYLRVFNFLSNEELIPYYARLDSQISSPVNVPFGYIAKSQVSTSDCNLQTWNVARGQCKKQDPPRPWSCNNGREVQ